MKTTFYPVGDTGALHYAKQFLISHGWHCAASPGPDVTHVLLPAPSFSSDGRIQGGFNPWHLLSDLSDNVTVIGGNLNHPSLHGYQTIDLLQDPIYLAENAAITADCAIRIAGQNLPVVFRGCSVLVIGWGRIGTSVAWQLHMLGAAVTVAARKETDRALAGALGFQTISFPLQACESYRVVINTVPFPVLDAGSCADDCVLLDLASNPGIQGDHVLWAKGLPGKLAPASSGQLMGKTILRLAERR